MQDPKPVNLSTADFEQIKQEVANSNLSDSTKKLITGLMQMNFWMQNALNHSRISIAKLKKMFFGGSEKRPPKSKKEEDGLSTSKQPNNESAENAENVEKKSGTSAAPLYQMLMPYLQLMTKTKKIKGHGKNGAEKFTSAKVITLHHPNYKAGDYCPLLCGGKLYPIDPGVFIRIEGNTLLSAYQYETEKLRCALCGELFKTKLPEHITEKYDEKAKSIITIMKYQLGVPWYRLAQWQQQIGIPIPDTTQWGLVLDVHKSCARIFDLLVTLAAQSELFYQDDTTVRILSVMNENKMNTDKKKRTGQFTTGIVAYHENYPIYLFFSGTKHAGENLSEVLSHRDKTLPDPFQMCDALNSNHVESHLITILCHYLIHGRRQFIDIEALYPKFCAKVLDSIAKIFHHEAHCKKNNFTPKTRLIYHQENSQPIMLALKKYLEENLKNPDIEPNGPLADAFNYLLKRWPELTRFLTHEGAPLDTNIVERALKLAIRIRKASLFHKTSHGALVASQMMSIIHTALQSGIEPVAYLCALQKYEQDVLNNPYDWLPWYYENTLSQLQTKQADDKASLANLV